MWMSIVLLPSDDYEHQHVLRHSGAPNEKALRGAIAQTNPDIHVLHVEPDVSPETVKAAAARIREEDPLHDPLHPADLTRRDPAKVAAEQAEAARRAAPSVADALGKAREAHAKFKADRAPEPAAPAGQPPPAPAAPPPPHE